MTILTTERFIRVLQARTNMTENAQINGWGGLFAKYFRSR